MSPWVESLLFYAMRPRPETEVWLVVILEPWLEFPDSECVGRDQYGQRHSNWGYWLDAQTMRIGPFYGDQP